jgi:hypothetical protein
VHLLVPPACHNIDTLRPEQRGLSARAVGSSRARMGRGRTMAAGLLLDKGVACREGQMKPRPGA